MFDYIKDFLSPKRFGIVSYICAVLHFIIGSIFSATTGMFTSDENGKFSCSVLANAVGFTTNAKKDEEVCLERYKNVYFSSFPLYGFALLSVGLPLVVCILYSLIVTSRVDEIASRVNSELNREIENVEPKSGTFYLLKWYVIHLVLRSLLGIIFTVLQYTYFYPESFLSIFECNLPETHNSNRKSSNSNRLFNETLVKCTNRTAVEKRGWGITLSVINTIIACIMMVEIIYIFCRLQIFKCKFNRFVWNNDKDFVTSHLLRKPYASLSRHEDILPLYKQKVSSRPRPHDINYVGSESGVDEMYIDVVIHTERAPLKFSKDMERHEIYDVYTKVPEKSTRLETIKDLFYPNEDTNSEFPRSILVVGRPGIGKTVLAEKILRDWANEVDDFYSGKMIFFFKFRWFNDNAEELGDVSLMKLLRLGTNLSERKFQRIFDDIISGKLKPIFIFDGLDEFNADPSSSFDISSTIPDDLNATMSVANWLIKICFGNVLNNSIILVTSRPTAEDFYSHINFDRRVEIIGFTTERIEQYVERFCDNANVSEQKDIIWNNIKSSSELSNLCYIPVNCFIVCVTLSGCASDSRDDNLVLPTTLSELYTNALHYFQKYESVRNSKINPMNKEELMKLQELAFNQMESNKLIFDDAHLDKAMKKSCLLNNLPNPLYSFQAQCCFIHLTIQEFLAAKHVVETFEVSKINEFISQHIGNGRWHLVLQFIAGLLGNAGNDCMQFMTTLAESSQLKSGQLQLKYENVFVLKCLKEFNGDGVIKNICESTVLNNVEDVCSSSSFALTPSDWRAVFYVCRDMRNLTKLSLSFQQESSLAEIVDYIRERHVSQLVLSNQCDIRINVCHVFNALNEQDCTMNIDNVGMTALELKGFHIETETPSLKTFFNSNRAGNLKSLHVENISGDTHCLWAAIGNGCCTQLTTISIKGCFLQVIDVNHLCGRARMNVTSLHLQRCMLSSHHIRQLCDALRNPGSRLNDLCLSHNHIDDEGARMLFDALLHPFCKVTVLSLQFCSLTDRCLPKLRDVLLKKKFPLTRLFLHGNAFTAGGTMSLRNVARLCIISFS